MLKKWELVPAPSEKNPDRQKLLIKGEMKDIFLIVKKLGSICSRPEKTIGAFDFIIYLSRLEADVMSKLKAVTAELGSISGEQESEPLFKATVGLVELPKPAPAPKPSASPAAKPSPQIKPASAPAAAAPAPVTAPPAAQSGRVLPPMNFVPSASARVQKDEPVPVTPAAQEHKPHPTSAASSKIKTKWSMELPLIPTYNFQTLMVGSHNRFAHAAAMAVVENPGMIYNPMLLFGAPGSGKTHFVNAVSNGLAVSLGQSNVFVTNGVKFSKGVDIAIQEGGVSRLDELFSGIKALIIDDIHLLMVTATNKKYISKWLNDFVVKNKQVIVTSLFPPKSLAGLEDALGFQFTQGWMVDLKIPPPQNYKIILNQLLQGSDVKISETDAVDFFVQPQMPFGEAIAVFERMRKLEKFLVNSTNSLSHAQLLEMLLGRQEPPQSAPSESELSSLPPWQDSAQEEWFKWGIFYPKGLQREAQYVLSKIDERAKELGLNTNWRQVFMEEYDPEAVYGTPFKIGNYAGQSGVNGVIVLGPPASSAIGTQEPEFRHLSLKILDSFFIKSAWLPMEKMKSPATYAKVLMDLL